MGTGISVLIKRGRKPGKGWSSCQPPKGSIKESANHRAIALISQASKVMLKILHAGLQHYANQELSDFQVGFRKGRGTRNQIANICWIIEKAREFQKNVYLSFTDYTKAFVWIMTNCGKLLKRWEYQTILPVFWETCMWIKKQQLDPCMEQLVASRLRKEFDRTVCCHPVCLTYTLSTEECWAGWLTSWNQDRWEKHQQLQICGWYHSNGKKQRGT